jgi:hypothetical protein
MLLQSSTHRLRDQYAEICQLFRLWLGIAEYLYRNEELLNESIENAITDNTHVADDLEFTFAARVSLKTHTY